MRQPPKAKFINFVNTDTISIHPLHNTSLKMKSAKNAVAKGKKNLSEDLRQQKTYKKKGSRKAPLFKCF